MTPPESAPFPLLATDDQDLRAVPPCKHARGSNLFGANESSSSKNITHGAASAALRRRASSVSFLHDRPIAHDAFIHDSPFEHLTHIPFTFPYVHVDELWAFDG